MSNNTFEKWEDVLPYIGKQVGVRVVESPDIKGTFTGLNFWTDEKTGEIKKVFIRLNEWPGRFEFWQCYPVTDKYKVYTPPQVPSDLSPFRGGTSWEQGIVYAPYTLQTNLMDVNGEVVWYRNKWKNLWLKFKRLFYKSKNYKVYGKCANKKIEESRYGTIKVD